MSEVLSRIIKARHAILADNEEPRDVLIGVDLQDELRSEMGPMMLYQVTPAFERLMGMNIEWTRPGTKLSIRTTAGDLRRVS